LQDNINQELADLVNSTIFLGHQLQWLEIRLTNMQVRFMATADVIVVVTVLANFQIQIVQDL
jgi:regulatory protein YycI of two-component signal transduction system YycFG